MTDSKPTVLFLCTANSCRSQMAETILRKLAPGRFDVMSAGLAPAKEVHPLALDALKQKGYETDGLTPKSVRKFLGHVRIRYAIVVCARAARECPVVWPGVANRLVWPFDDPAAVTGTDEETKAAFARVRDEIEVRLRAWLEELDKQ